MEELLDKRFDLVKNIIHEYSCFHKLCSFNNFIKMSKLNTGEMNVIKYMDLEDLGNIDLDIVIQKLGKGMKHIQKEVNIALEGMIEQLEYGK